MNYLDGESYLMDTYTNETPENSYRFKNIEGNGILFTLIRKDSNGTSPIFVVLKDKKVSLNS